MFCPRCGRSNEHNHTYCLSCGAHLDSFATVVQARPTKKKQQILISVGVVAAVMVLAVVSGIALYFYQRTSELEQATRTSPSQTGMQAQTNSQAQSQPLTPTPIQIKPTPVVVPQEQPTTEQPQYQPPQSTRNMNGSMDADIASNTNVSSNASMHSSVIVNSTFPVDPQQYRYFTFSVADSSVSNLKGDFRATGGRNDIDVWVIDANQMANFANGHSTYSYYHSGYISYGEINLRLKPGAYYIIFSNRAALLTNKVVTAKIYLS